MVDTIQSFVTPINDISLKTPGYPPPLLHISQPPTTQKFTENIPATTSNSMHSVKNADTQSPQSSNTNTVSLNKSIIQINNECRKIRNSEYYGTGSDPQQDVYSKSLKDQKYSSGIPYDTGKRDNKSCKSLSFVTEPPSAMHMPDTTSGKHPIPPQKDKISINQTDVPIDDEPQLSHD